MYSSRLLSSSRIYILLASIALAGCASVPGEKNPNDPLEPFNRSMFKFNEDLDKAVLKPLAKGYSTLMPEPGQIMVSNFFSNLDDILVTINDLLQLKFEQAASDGVRVLFNSTFGILGLINVTDRLEKHNEDFGQTLGFWGIKSGPYVVLPFFGPRTIRDSAGLYVDSYANPIRYLSYIPTRNKLYAIRTVNYRAEALDDEKILEEAAIDRYAFIRDGYLQQRQNLIYDGNPPREKFDDEDELPDGSSAPDNTPANDSKETVQPAAGTSINQPDIEQPVQPQPAANMPAEPGTQPEKTGNPADQPFNPYRTEPLIIPDRAEYPSPN